MHHINQNKTGLALGSFFGVVHLAWAVMVALGWAKPFMDWIFGLHFITPPYTISAFKLGTAIGLVIATAVIGYVFGWLFAWLWNYLHSR